MTTIAREARFHFANATAPLADLVTRARFAAIVADFDFSAVTIDADEHEFECHLCGHGTDEIFTREACETCVDTLHLGYVAD